MADVNAQSVEDYADRIVYRYPGGRYEQTAAQISSVLTPGLKVLVNTDTFRSYIIPASGITARFFKIEWVFNLAIQVNNALGGVYNMLIKQDFMRYVTPAPALNYDGRSLQTEFYTEKTENIYSSPQLRAINITNISVEPKAITANLLNTVQFDFNFGTSSNFLVAILQPTVTFYKK